MNTKIINLRSGRWRLTDPVTEGSRLLKFDSVERPGDLLLVQTDGHPVSDAALRGMAAEPDARHWVDDEGTRWVLSLQLPKTIGVGPRPPDLPREALWLHFATPTRVVGRDVPLTTSLAELTHEEIASLLGE